MCQIKFSLNGMEGLSLITVKAIELILFFYFHIFKI